MNKKKESLETNTKKKTPTKKKLQVKKEQPEIVIETTGFSLDAEGNLNINEVRNLSTISIEELFSYEKACALVCGRYEVKSRLSGIDNAKFIEFSDYHTKIIEEMEKRVLALCSKH